MKTLPKTSAQPQANRARWAALGVCLGSVLTGAPINAANIAPDPRGDEEIRLAKVFTSHLPDTMRAKDLRLWIHPHLGDLKDRDHLRSSTGIRYGLARWWEIGASTDIYFSHGIGDAKFGRKYGATSVELATKFNLGRRLFSGWDTAVGADFAYPVGHPPAELTDGLRHYGPWATFSRRMKSHPTVRVFGGIGADFIRQMSVVGTFGRNQFLNDNARVTAGFVIDHARLHYTFESTVTTDRGIGSGHDDVISLRPGIIWEVPPKNNPNGKSNLIIGAGLNVQFGPNGTSLGGSLKLRYNLDVKELLGIGKRSP